MTSDYAKELLRTGIIEVKAKHFDSARRYLDRAIYMARSHDVIAEAWFWMSEAVETKEEKRKALENCLSHDLRHARARRALAIVEGKIKSDEVINPDNLPPAPQGLREADAQRFMCPKCGARMSFAPDGSNALVCDYCTTQHALGIGAKNEDEKDFIVAMATMKGHGKPLQEQAFHCNGCGAEFILPPKQISANCVYCDSPHVVSLEKTKDLLAPDAILPFAVDQKQAIKNLIQWVEKNQITPEKKVELPRGLYLSLWTFDVGGSIEYTGEVYERQEDAFGGKQTKTVQFTGEYPILMNDHPIPASRKLSSVFLELIPTFDLKKLEPYDPRYLAGFPAEIYDVPMADASLDARSQAFNHYKKELPYLIGKTNITRTSSAKIMIESFKLNLLPVWMTELPFDGREHLVLINGQNGFVESDLDDAKEDGGLFSWLGDLLGE